jgi:glycosyltransferase involved in cell wall biosynthesis
MSKRHSAAARRLLIVGMHNSPHAHRWLRMIARPDTAILLFPVLSFPYELPEGFTGIRMPAATRQLPPGLWVVDPADVQSEADKIENRRLGYVPFSHSFVDPALLATPQRLIALIDAFQPHFLHSMEVQMAGYLCEEAARRLGPRFPRWILSNWGSDLSLFRKLPGHEERLRKVCRRIDLYMGDCARDQVLARAFGYRGPVLPIVPASGGMDIDAISQFATEPPSARRVIMIKGYHNWAGRGLLALSAVQLAKEHLRDYRIQILAASASMKQWAAAAAAHTGLSIEPLGYAHDHFSALRRLAQARALIGISISDGIATTVLEAMMLGVFPIQSSTACVDEWITHGRSGLIVSPHDTREMADALIRAASDDALVDAAAEENLRTIRSRWDIATNAARIWEIYEPLLQASEGARA